MSNPTDTAHRSGDQPRHQSAEHPEITSDAQAELDQMVEHSALSDRFKHGVVRLRHQDGLPGGRHVERRFHRRVARLHRRWHEATRCALPGTLTWEGLRNTGLLDRLRNPAELEAMKVGAPPFGVAHKAAGRKFSSWVMPLASLEEALHQRVSRLRVSDATKMLVYLMAYRWSVVARMYDPSVRVCAEFGVDQATLELGDHRRFALGDHAAPTWRRGRSISDGPLAHDDLISLEHLPSQIIEARSNGVVDAIWEPTRARQGTGLDYWADRRRPPIEALGLLADVLFEREPAPPPPPISVEEFLATVLETESETPKTFDDLLEEMVRQANTERAAPRTRVLACGFGHEAAGQAFSAMLGPSVQVVVRDGEHGRPRWPALPRCPEMIVVNATNDTFSEAALEDALRCIDEHWMVGESSEALAPIDDERNPMPLTFALLSELGLHHDLCDMVEAALPVKPHRFLDTTSRAVLIRYPKLPWTPLGIEPPTNRLLSIWRVSRCS